MAKDTKKEQETKEEPQKQDPKDLKIKELTDIAQRLQADFENYKKRSEKECKDYRCFAEADLIRHLLPILDSFELALKNHHDKGFEMIYAQFLTTLEKRGLRKINAEGMFNPELHEVMLTDKIKEKKDHEILEELQSGYLLNNRVIRTAKVKVNKL